MRGLSWQLSWRDQLSASLPILLMAVLAAGTWWLVRHTPQSGEARQAAAVQHTVDYEMHGFNAHYYAENGQSKIFLQGQTLWHYADDESIEIAQIQAEGVDKSGRQIYAQANKGVGYGLLGGEQQEIHLLGQAKVVRDALAEVAAASIDNKKNIKNDRLEVTGEFLKFYPKEGRIQSEAPVSMLTDSGAMYAGGLDYNAKTGLIALEKGIKGIYKPAAR